MQKLISIDLKADFGFFRKPDTNSTVNFSFNIIHKPALLGILGAVIGLDGYKELGKLPAYYDALKNIKVGIQPLYHDKGNFRKTVIKYSNTIGYANKGGPFLTEEAVLINPAYRIYLLLEVEDFNQKKLFEFLKEGKAEYLPYFGKNECSAWVENFEENYPVEKNVFNGESFEIKSIFSKSIFSKSIVVKDSLADNGDDFTDIDIDFINSENPFVYFERLPLKFDEAPLLQYKLEPFSFTTGKMKPHVRLPNLFRIQPNQYVQLF